MSTTPTSAERDAFISVWNAILDIGYQDTYDLAYKVWQARGWALSQPVPAAEPAPGPWHDWSGGECPVAGEVYVDVKFRKGESLRTDKSFVFDWWHNSRGGDIIAWRYAAVTPVAQPEQTAYDQGSLPLCETCGWNAIDPTDDKCMLCAKRASPEQTAEPAPTENEIIEWLHRDLAAMTAQRDKLLLQQSNALPKEQPARTSIRNTIISDSRRFQKAMLTAIAAASKGETK